ncbi:MAG: DUF4336 domain-containing protein [Labilithrix sp.]|nr:DUF4336 domain-containing protein [Labilithrix sp.]MCW5834161.1 DUF4336 domain-containing protein [Labilithrix sp.]
MLAPFAEDVWIEARPLRFFGVEVGTRMTVVRMRDGGLFVHSPVALDDATREAVDALGEVRAIVAPSLFHHLYVGEWASAYPKATLGAAPGLEVKRADVAWTHVLGDAPLWADDFDQVHVSSRTMENEVVFFHRESRTIVSCDIIFNLASHPSWVTRAVGRLLGAREPGPTVLEHVMMRRRRAKAREEIDRVVAWGAERLVIAHGDPIASNASDVLARGFSWL